MARFRIWLCGHVRTLLTAAGRKTRTRRRFHDQKSTMIRDLEISAPLLFTHENVQYVPDNEFPRSLSVQDIKGPHPELFMKHQSSVIEVPQSIAMVIEDSQAITASNLDGGELDEIASSVGGLQDDSDSFMDRENTKPSVPSFPPMRRRFSTRGGLSITSDRNCRGSMFLPQSHVDSSSSETRDAKRMSHYSVMSRTMSKRGKRISVASGPGGRRASVIGGRRASVMSDSWEWRERRSSRVSNNRLSLGVETCQALASMYAPVRL
ncbi:hypothetical protein FB567DRAFT_113998 [Paraphoma chrysanthemicola]|uniref:Uncharacterized protein n=1 Tax=Paraphoma chrysanthemicola TaxID=798071 RepID=A0A8K0QZW7_9PLEO|nr:hypothetical protein FB567DRAFT_113998 [Paraphoma chrysanthemicola]